MKEICGDIPLTRREQLCYLLQNAARNIAGLRYPSRTVFWHHLYDDMTDTTPMRAYLNAFMKEMLPKIIPSKHITVLDIGCGTAYMRTILAENGYSGAYTGVDIVREPKLKEDAIEAFTMKFLQQDISTLIPSQTFDLVLSNTSLEHIPDDFNAVQKAHQLTKESGIEVHIMPTYWSLPLYLWHGYRQYTPARVHKMFSGSTYTIYRLGGLASFLIHLFLITFPERIAGRAFIRQRALYPRLKSFANKADRFFPFSSTLYAVVVSH
jgi:ubiquinone/menaquinone biosynthesis C-methylase UbiE